MIKVREIPREEVEQSQIDQLDQFGFTLVYKVHCIQIWVEEAAS